MAVTVTVDDVAKAVNGRFVQMLNVGERYRLEGRLPAESLSNDVSHAHFAQFQIDGINNNRRPELESAFAAAVARVNLEAPEAPAEAANEAVIRSVAYQMEVPPGRSIASAWIASGAAAALAPYRPRRAV